MLFANILQFALVTQPHNVLGVTRHGEEYRRYTTTTGLVQLLLALLLGVVAAIVAGGARIKQLPITPQLDRAHCFVNRCFWQLQEFIRRVMYTWGRPHRRAHSPTTSSATAARH